MIFSHRKHNMTERSGEEMTNGSMIFKTKPNATGIINQGALCNCLLIFISQTPLGLDLDPKQRNKNNQGSLWCKAI